MIDNIYICIKTTYVFSPSGFIDWSMNTEGEQNNETYLKEQQQGFSYIVTLQRPEQSVSTVAIWLTEL